MVSKALARQIIREVKKQKRPKIYCVLKYRVVGHEYYVLCDNREEFEKIRGSYVIELIWSGKLFEKDVQEWAASIKN